jgi:thioredoxin 1
MMVHITNVAQFNKIKALEKVIIKFSANWCGPCKAMAPEFESLSKQYPSIAFVEVDIEKCPEIAEAFGVQSLPTFVALRKSVVVGNFMGANKAQLRQMVTSI